MTLLTRLRAIDDELKAALTAAQEATNQAAHAHDRAAVVTQLSAVAARANTAAVTASSLRQAVESGYGTLGTITPEEARNAGAL